MARCVVTSEDGASTPEKPIPRDVASLVLRLSLATTLGNVSMSNDPVSMVVSVSAAVLGCLTVKRRLLHACAHLQRLDHRRHHLGLGAMLDAHYHAVDLQLDAAPPRAARLLRLGLISQQPRRCRREFHHHRSEHRRRLVASLARIPPPGEELRLHQPP